MHPQLIELPYPDDPLHLAGHFLGRHWMQWLDSADTDRYDILVAEPHATLVTRNGVTEIWREGEGVRHSDADPLLLLRGLLQPLPPPVSLPVPFCGGAVGYFAYDLARRFEPWPVRAVDDVGWPEMAVGIYDWAVVRDRQERRCWLAGSGRAPATAEHRREWQARLAERPPPLPDGFCLAGDITSNLDWPDYADRVARIHRYLRAGDCYQVNFAQRFTAEVRGAPFALYRALRQRNPAPFSAYLDFPFGQILSASPERFLQVRGREVLTQPIKGTRPRHGDAQADAAEREALCHSAKDRAENLMIVDLLRNDLGKNCAVGSVRVPRLWAVESFATVHHLVSTVTGHLAPGRDALDLLRGCFPGGSITGAPKRRAMEIIEELEPHRRGVYCGAIGYIGFDGAMDSNIAIRSLTHREGRVWFGAGGGIVTDSRAEAEYAESLDKAAALLQLLEQCRCR